MSGESEPVADIDIDSDMTYIDLDINRERRTYIDMETATYSDIDSVNNNDTANDDTDNNDTDNNDPNDADNNDTVLDDNNDVLTDLKIGISFESQKVAEKSIRKWMDVNLVPLIRASKHIGTLSQSFASVIYMFHSDNFGAKYRSLYLQGNFGSTWTLTLAYTYKETYNLNHILVDLNLRT